MARSFSILLLEDDPATVDILQRVAIYAFPEAVFVLATSYGEAVDYLCNLEGLCPRLVLIDINLIGNKTGLDFLHLLKQQEMGRLIPMVVLSASVARQDMLTAYRLGAASFTNKPDTLAGWRQLLELLRSYWYETVRLPDIYLDKDSLSDQE